MRHFNVKLLVTYVTNVTYIMSKDQTVESWSDIVQPLFTSGLIELMQEICRKACQLTKYFIFLLPRRLYLTGCFYGEDRRLVNQAQRSPLTPGLGCSTLSPLQGLLHQQHPGRAPCHHDEDEDSKEKEELFNLTLVQ